MAWNESQLPYWNRSTSSTSSSPVRNRDRDDGPFGNIFGKSIDREEGLGLILGLGALFAGLGSLGGGAAAAEGLGPAASGGALGSTSGIGGAAPLGNTAGLLSPGASTSSITGMGMGSGGTIAGVTPSLAGGAGANLGAASSGGGFMQGVGKFFGSNNIGDGQFTFGDITDSMDILSQVNSMGGGYQPAGSTAAPRQQTAMERKAFGGAQGIKSNTEELDKASDKGESAGKGMASTYVDNLNKNVNPETMTLLGLLQNYTDRNVALPGLLALSGWDTYKQMRGK